jgi:hypothetical protein
MAACRQHDGQWPTNGQNVLSACHAQTINQTTIMFGILNDFNSLK